MKMSSRGRCSERRPVAQHRPQDIDPATCQRDESLGMSLSLSPLAVVEGSGLRQATQAGERRLVKDPLEHLVSAPHPAVVSDPFTGVMSGRYEPGVGSESIGIVKGSEVPNGYAE